ncbi:hypothetical protein [Priestia megaterium]|nr:hypothetical protein [Priestia megaterium]WJD82025.1 hypothetical protein QRD24_05895 [Priestia megaterium]
MFKGYTINQMILLLDIEESEDMRERKRSCSKCKEPKRPSRFCEAQTAL